MIPYAHRKEHSLNSFNTLKSSGNYIYHLLYQSTIVRFVFVGII
jgi:hypothetical protein